MSLQAPKWAIQRVFDIPEKTDISQTEFTLLLTLATFANVDGRSIYPSTERMARMSRLSLRTVMRCLSSLLEKGFLVCEGFAPYATSQKRIKSYRINFQALEGDAYEEPEDFREPAITELPPAKSKPKAAAVKKPMTAIAKAEKDEIPEWIQLDLWDGFEEVRRLKKKPLTAIAKARIIAKLQKMKDMGHDPNEALGLSIENGWTGVFEPSESEITSKRAKRRSWGEQVQEARKGDFGGLTLEEIEQAEAEGREWLDV